MRKRIAAVAVVCLTILTLGAPAGAYGFFEVGSNCAANESIGTPTSLVQTEKAPDTLPIVAPTDGVVTAWRVNIAGVIGPTPQRLLVLRATGEPLEFHVSAVSALEQLGSGQNFFKTRISVLAGERFGLYGPETFFCKTGNPADVGYGHEGESSTGTTYKFLSKGGEAQIPVSALIEPDADGDGYGDETQDGCPGNSSEHGQCPGEPVVAPPGPIVPRPLLDALAIRHKRAVTVLVTTNTTAQVSASGFVMVPNPACRKRRPCALVARSLRIDAPPQMVAAGQLARVRLAFTKRLRTLLRRGQLRGKKRGFMTIVVRANNAAGSVNRALRTKLPDQKRKKRGLS